MSELGERIRRERLRRGERQIDTAERFDVSQATLHRWEAGLNRPDVERLAAVADYLGMKVDEIYHLAMDTPMPISLTNVQAEVDALRRTLTTTHTELAEVRSRLDALEHQQNNSSAH